MDTRSNTEIETESINMLHYVPISEERLAQIQQETAKDEDLDALREVIRKGWPENRNETPVCVQPYFSFSDELSVQNGLIFKGERIVVPHTLRQELLNSVHSGHIGIQGCMRRAR